VPLFKFLIFLELAPFNTPYTFALRPPINLKLGEKLGGVEVMVAEGVANNNNARVSVKITVGAKLSYLDYNN